MKRFPQYLMLLSLVSTVTLVGCNKGNNELKPDDKSTPQASTPLPEKAEANLDSDGDGVPNADDACPKVAGVSQDNKFQTGCPVQEVAAPAATESDSAPTAAPAPEPSDFLATALSACFKDPEVGEACATELRNAYDYGKAHPNALLSTNDQAKRYADLFIAVTKKPCAKDPSKTACALLVWKNRKDWKEYKPTLNAILNTVNRIATQTPSRKPAPRASGGGGAKPSAPAKPAPKAPPRKGKLPGGSGAAVTPNYITPVDPGRAAVTPPGPGNPVAVVPKPERKKKLICQEGFQAIANGLNIECLKKKGTAPKAHEKTRDEWLNWFNQRFNANDVDAICGEYARLKKLLPLNANLASVQNQCPGQGKAHKKNLLEKIPLVGPLVIKAGKTVENLLGNCKKTQMGQTICMYLIQQGISDFREDRRNHKLQKALRQWNQQHTQPGQVAVPVVGPGNDLTVPNDTTVGGVTPTTPGNQVPVVPVFQTITPVTNPVMDPPTAPPISQPGLVPVVPVGPAQVGP